MWFQTPKILEHNKVPYIKYSMNIGFPFNARVVRLTLGSTTSQIYYRIAQIHTWNYQMYEVKISEFKKI